MAKVPVMESVRMTPTRSHLMGSVIGPVYVDSDAPNESARSQDSNHQAEDLELDDEIRTIFINVRQKAKKARNSMAQRCNSSPSVTHSILAIWPHYILMPSIANRHQQNYSAK